MGRGKLQLKLIENWKQRLLTYRKRTGGLKKKAHELSTLCGVPTLVVCVGPTGKAERAWPESDEEAAAIVDKLRRCAPAAQSDDKRRMDLVDYLLAQLAKPRSGCELSELPLEVLRELQRSVDARMAAVKERMLSLGIRDEEDVDLFSELTVFSPSVAPSDFQEELMPIDDLSSYAPHGESEQIGPDALFDAWANPTAAMPQLSDFQEELMPIDDLSSYAPHGGSQQIAPDALFDAWANPTAAMPQLSAKNGLPQVGNADERMTTEWVGGNVATWEEEDFSAYDPKVFDPCPWLPPTPVFDAWAVPWDPFGFGMLDSSLLSTGDGSAFQDNDMAFALNGKPYHDLEQGSRFCPEPQQSNMTFGYFPPGLQA